MNPSYSTHQKIIRDAFLNRELLRENSTIQSVQWVLQQLEKGTLRVCSPAGMGPDCGSQPMDESLNSWVTHSWVKEAILLAMAIRSVHTVHFQSSTPTPPDAPIQRRHMGQWGYADKFDLRQDLGQAGVRVVPPGAVREGAYLEPGCIVMPGYVNIGAWVGKGSMVDTWATVGSCAQIGSLVHLAGGVGIGGVLEPAGARPVLIGDEAFIGSRVIVVEGAIVGARAVLGAGCIVTASTPIIDVTQKEPKEYRGFVPPGAVVAPGTRPKEFPGGTVSLQCAYIIGYRSSQTDAKVSLNQVLRETGIAL